MDPFNSYMNRLVKYPQDAITATVERPIHPPQWPTNVSQPSVKVIRKKKSTSTRSDHEADRMSNASEASYEIISNVSSHSPPLLGNNIQTTSTSVQTSESQLTLVSPSDSQVVSIHDDPNCGHQQYIDDLNSQVHSLQAELNSLKYQAEMNRANDQLGNQVPMPNYHQHWSVPPNCGHEGYIDELTCRVTSLNDELHSSKSQNELLLKQIEELKGQQLKSDVTDRGTDPPTETLGHHDEQVNYGDILAAKEEEILALKDEMDGFRLHSEQIIASERHINARHLSSIQKELRECKNQLSAMTQQASGYKTEIEALKSSLVTQESLTAQLAQEKVSLMSQIDSKQATINHLNLEVEMFKQQHEQQRQQQQQNENIGQELSANKQHEQQILPLSMAHVSQSEISILNEQLNQLKLENNSLKDTISKLNDDLKNVRIKSDEEINKLTMDYSARIEQLRDENLKSDSIQTDLEQSLNATRQELLQVLQKLHSITKASIMRNESSPVTSQASTSPIGDHQQQQLTLQQGNDRQVLLDELDELKKQLTLRDASIEELTTKLSQYAAYYGNEIARLARELETSNSKASYMENELITSQHFITSMRAQEQQLKEAIDKVISSNSKLRGEMVNTSLAHKEDVLASVRYLEDFLTRQSQEAIGFAPHQQQEILNQVNSLAEEIDRIDV